MTKEILVGFKLSCEKTMLDR